MMPKAVIFGCAGESLSEEEKIFFKKENPFGFILFARNCKTPEQIRSLTAALREVVGRANLFILIDQEGGRVARLKPPHFRAAPPAGRFAETAASNSAKAVRATYLNAWLIAQELVALGITVNCAPMADLLIEGSHDIIGDRAFGAEPGKVAMLARAMADGLRDGGIFPVLKHIPGHGRARVDSHESLPVVEQSLEVLEQTDFKPFCALNDLPFAMTAHILYTVLDAENPATVSPKVIDYIRHKIGFVGLLMSDDLSMKALDGDCGKRACDSIQAGCDLVLHCNGNMEEMRAVAEATPFMREARWKFAEEMWKYRKSSSLDWSHAQAEFDDMMGQGAQPSIQAS